MLLPVAKDPVCVASGAQQDPSVVPDGASGRIAVWEDFRDVGSGGDSTLYAQRINGPPPRRPGSS